MQPSCLPAKLNLASHDPIHLCIMKNKYVPLRKYWNEDVDLPYGTETYSDLI